ncbi:PTS glucitol/sorbitol transporter subunit IIA [Klebsiella variicola subsp. variicola]|nr:PTS glucitol/sorbitol transporter subunit IIA [Klebsiella variicola subsp. variicola]
MSALCGSSEHFILRAVPTILASYCAVHQASELTAELSPGQRMRINDKNYQVTAVGGVAASKFTTAWPISR